MKKNINEKSRLMLTLAICILFITVVFSSVVGKPQVKVDIESDNTEPVSYNDPMSTGIFNFRILNRDWNYWSNKPHLFSMVTGNVGIGEMPPDDAKLFVKTNQSEWKYAIYAEGQKGIKGISTALDGTGIIGEGGHAGVKGIGSYIGIIGQGYYGGWFEGIGYFSGNLGIGTTDPEAKLDVRGGDITVNGFEVEGFVGTVKQNDSFTIYTPWTDVPGVIFHFNLPINKSVNLRAYGSNRISTSSHAGFRFVIDDIPYGDPDYGDLIVSGGGGAWHPWYIERIVELSSGEHYVKLQMRCPSGEIISDGEDYDAAKLFVEAW